MKKTGSISSAVDSYGGMQDQEQALLDLIEAGDRVSALKAIQAAIWL
jgi:hypothetical protein